MPFHGERAATASNESGVSPAPDGPESGERAVLLLQPCAEALFIFGVFRVIPLHLVEEFVDPRIGFPSVEPVFGAPPEIGVVNGASDRQFRHVRHKPPSW